MGLISSSRACFRKVFSILTFLGFRAWNLISRCSDSNSRSVFLAHISDTMPLTYVSPFRLVRCVRNVQECKVFMPMGIAWRCATSLDCDEFTGWVPSSYFHRISAGLKV